MADDMEENITLVRLFLERESHQVVGVVNGLQAVERFQKEAFDIILMDVNMPVMGGVEATKKIRSLELKQGGHTPIIAFTASDSEEEKREFENAGMDGIITKPINFADLFNLIDSLMEQKKGGEEAVEESLPMVSALPFSSEGGMDKIEGLHIEKAIITWGSIERFNENLHGFYQRYLDTPKLISNYLEHHDYDGLKALAHALKGVSGNLCLTRLYPLCITLDNAAEKRDREKIMVLLQSLQTEFDTIPDYLSELKLIQNRFPLDGTSVGKGDGKSKLESPPSLSKPFDQGRFNPTSSDLSTVASLLSDLIASFDRYSPDASLPFVSKLRDVIDPEQLEPIMEWIDRFDFDRAREAAERLKNQLFNQ